MIVRKLQDAAQTERNVESQGWSSVRMLLRDDQMGFSFHITTILQGADLDMHYQNHFESVYCMSGFGKLIDRETGIEYPIAPGTMYALNKNDKHTLQADTQMKMACVFNPPLVGNEVHNAEGAYESSQPESSEFAIQITGE